jgi:glycosyltransferase involved in cell wall biosynthesis
MLNSRKTNKLSNQRLFSKQFKGIFIIWGAFQGSRRSEHLAKHFNIELEYIYCTNKQGLIYTPIKYIYQAIVTILLLFKRRPDVVFIQNPPTLAPVFVYVYCLILKKKFIIDTHTGALIYSQWKWTIPIQKFLTRRAITTLLTNENLANQVSSWKANSFVLEDPPIVTTAIKRKELKSCDLKIIVVGVGYIDEPIREIIDVARNLSNMDFYITGDFRKNKFFNDILYNAPLNVYFTGFLKEGYFALLEAADVIVCLTKDDNTFQSGANEALWIGKPLITSDWPILREYFNKGTIHVDNSIESIQEALIDMQKNLFNFKKDMISLQDEKRRLWHDKAKRLLDLIKNTKTRCSI